MKKSDLKKGHTYLCKEKIRDDIYPGIKKETIWSEIKEYKLVRSYEFCFLFLKGNGVKEHVISFSEPYTGRFMMKYFIEADIDRNLLIIEDITPSGLILKDEHEKRN